MTLTPEEINELADILEANDGGQELRGRLRQAAAELSALQKENDLLRQHVVSESWQATIDERDSLRTQNRELREALQRIYSRTFRGASITYDRDRIAAVCKEALALQPEK